MCRLPPRLFGETPVRTFCKVSLFCLYTGNIWYARFAKSGGRSATAPAFAARFAPCAAAPNARSRCTVRWIVSYLQDARKHDKTPPVNPDQFPNQDIKVTDDFLHENEELLVFLGRALISAVLESMPSITMCGKPWTR